MKLFTFIIIVIAVIVVAFGISAAGLWYGAKKGEEARTLNEQVARQAKQIDDIRGDLNYCSEQLATSDHNLRQARQTFEEANNKRQQEITQNNAQITEQSRQAIDAQKREHERITQQHQERIAELERERERILQRHMATLSMMDQVKKSESEKMRDDHELQQAEYKSQNEGLRKQVDHHENVVDTHVNENEKLKQQHSQQMEILVEDHEAAIVEHKKRIAECDNHIDSLKRDNTMKDQILQIKEERQIQEIICSDDSYIEPFPSSQ